ncbi:MAG: hypothetical protein RJB01_196 [Actinomycetota bacterium]
MRIVFAGTPAVALPSLVALHESAHDVAAVITRPDAPAGRGRTLHPSPVAQYAHDAGIPVLKPSSMRNDEFVAELHELAPDAGCVVAYGGMIPAHVLAIPAHGWFNLHFSLLPQWRGAAPVQRAIWAGDNHSGCTVFQLDEGLDTGPIYAQAEYSINPEETAGEVLERLALSGAALLLGVVDSVSAGTAHGTPQESFEGPHAAKITVNEARIDWCQPAQRIVQQVRACTPDPGAWTECDSTRLRVLQMRISGDDCGQTLQPGYVWGDKNRTFVGTGSEPLELISVQPAGKRAMAASDWLRGMRGGEVLLQ